MAKPWKIPHIRARDRLSTAARAILTTRLKEVGAFEEAVMTTQDVESVHDMRIAARRLQAMMGIFRESLQARKYRNLEKTVRRLIRALGAVRERDIVMSILEEYRMNLPANHRRTLDLLLTRKHLEREHFRAALRRTLAEMHEVKFRRRFMKFAKNSFSSG